MESGSSSAGDRREIGMERQQRSIIAFNGLYRHLSAAIPRLTRGKDGGGDPRRPVPLTGGAALLLFLLLLLGALTFSRWNSASMISGGGAAIRDPISVTAAAATKAARSSPDGKGTVEDPISSGASAASKTAGGSSDTAEPKPDPEPEREQSKSPPLACPARSAANGSARLTACPSTPPRPSRRPPPAAGQAEPPGSCPGYFRWIHEDLRPWASTGITTEMVERARKTANFRLVVLGGRAYVEQYRKSFQSRDVLTIWGILQLLRRYPGRVPDLDLMFDCVDWPVVRKAGHGSDAVAPPPLFRYCGDDATLDIVFPDWSFWGWPEINIKPWERLRKELKEGNERTKWMDREPYAYWKGNPAVAAARLDLLRCNVSDTHDWNARVYAQDWRSEEARGFRQSDLAGQCRHRYKIYIEGSAWSVSEKYILACDSLTLLVKPRYYDFFTRGLVPVHHYWPVRDDDKCRSVKFAVDWGNSHKQKAQAIGREASNFIQEQLKMDYVYDYMFHLLNEYAKLLRFKPTVPPRAAEYCAESMACYARGRQREYMMGSLERSPGSAEPCTLPPPFDDAELERLMKRKANSIEQVEIWEKNSWEKQQT